MKKLTRRDFLRISATSAAGIALASCAKTAAPTATSPPAPTATTAAAAGGCQIDWNPTFPAFDKYDPAVEIMVEDTVDISCLETDLYDDNPMYNIRRDLMGIKFGIHWSASGEARAAKRAADIAAGTMADFFVANPTEAAQFINNDAAEEIRAIVDEVFSPLSKRVMHYPDGEAWVPGARGDKLYAIVEERGGGEGSNLCWIRQDWLDKLGLALPTTVAELEKTMRAFKEEGLSQFGIGASGYLISWAAGLDSIFGAYGVMPKTWRDYGDGKLTYGSILPENKEVLALLRGWYEDGLMHPDFYTFGGGDSFDQFTSQEVGVCFYPYWILQNMQAMEEENPGAKWTAYASIKGPGGKVGRRGNNDYNRSYLFRKGIERRKIEAVLKYLNWNNELFFNFPKYEVYQWFRGPGIWKEGYDWVWDENCELQQGPCWTGRVGTGHWIAQNLSNEAVNAYYDNVDLWINETDRSKLNKAQRLIGDPAMKQEVEVWKAAYNTLDERMLTQFLGVPGPVEIELTGQLGALEDAAYLEIIAGTRPLEDFDQFVADWKKGGGDDWAAEVNAWYDTQK